MLISAKVQKVQQLKYPEGVITPLHGVQIPFPASCILGPHGVDVG